MDQGFSPGWVCISGGRLGGQVGMASMADITVRAASIHGERAGWDEPKPAVLGVPGVYLYRPGGTTESSRGPSDAGANAPGSWLA